jgi:hypothetical protein
MPSLVELPLACLCLMMRCFVQFLLVSGKVGCLPEVIAASEVRPRDASRDPASALSDVVLPQSIGSSVRPWRRLPFALCSCRLERLVGISITVWLRGLSSLILDQYHLIRLPVLRYV